MEKMYYVEKIDGKEVKREYNAEEYALAAKEQKEWEDKQKARSNALAKLAALGLTEEEIAAL